MMATLSEQGFVPLHYLLYWVLDKTVLLTPGMMRIVPALAGIGMVPAVYLLSRGFGLSQRTAVFAAALAATSAWGFTYSRDAKMYSHTWLFVTVSWVFYLAFVRGTVDRGWVGAGLVLTGWVLASVVAVGLHATAGIALAVQLVCVPLFLRERVWRRSVALALGVGLIVAGPVWYYGFYNSYLERTGLVSLPQLSPATARSTEVTAAVPAAAPDWDQSGIQWVSQYNQGISPAELVLNTVTSQLLGVQWPRVRTDPGTYSTPPPDWFRYGITAAATALVATLAFGAIPRTRTTSHWGCTAAAGKHGAAERRGDSWRVWLCLGIWLVVPAYGVFYCRSFDDFASPVDGLRSVVGYFGLGWIGVVAAVLGVIALPSTKRGEVVGRALSGVWVLALVVSVVVAMWSGGLNWFWDWGALLSRWWVGPPMAALGLGIIWQRSGNSNRERMGSAIRFLGGMAVILLLCGAMYLFWMLERQWGTHGSTTGVHHNAAEGGISKSIWMPRYLGYAWPALLVLTAMLLERLPGRWTGVLALVAVCMLNVAQSVARLVVPAEPPTDRIALDLWESHNGAGGRRLFFNLAGSGGHHGFWYHGIDTHYYLYLLAPRGVTASADHRIEHVYEGRIRSEFRLAVDLSPAEIAGSAGPSVHRLVLWQRFSSSDLLNGRATNGDSSLAAPPKVLEDALGPTWQRVSHDTHTQYQFWTWRRGDTWVRTQYERVTP